jgi:hypothetical protein
MNSAARNARAVEGIQNPYAAMASKDVMLTIAARGELVRPWTHGGRAARAGHRLESEGVLAIQSPHPFKGWEIYLLDGSGLEMFAGYTGPESQALLDNTLAALLDARSEAA